MLYLRSNSRAQKRLHDPSPSSGSGESLGGVALPKWNPKAHAGSFRFQRLPGAFLPASLSRSFSGIGCCYLVTFLPFTTSLESRQYCIHTCIATSSSQRPGQVLHMVGVQVIFFYCCVTTRRFLRKVFPILIFRRLGDASSKQQMYAQKLSV